MTHPPLDLPPEHAADLMEAALAVADREPLPPGAELDRKVAEALGAELKGIWYTGTLRVDNRPCPGRHWIWANDERFESLLTSGRAEEVHPEYSTDPAASDEARRLARKKMGHPFTIQTGSHDFMCWIQTDGASIDEANESDERFLRLYIDTDGRGGVHGDTEAHAVALAIVAGAPAETEKDAT